MAKKKPDYHTARPTVIRGIDPEQWERVKREAAAQEAYIYQVVNQAFREYCDERDYQEKLRSVK